MQSTHSSNPTEVVQSRILIVDDHPLVRQGIAQYINQEPDMTVCGEASDGNQAIAVIESLKPDLVIVDIEMKGVSGLELVRNLQALYPDILVLMLSMHDENIYAQRALSSGARGYIMKEADPENVIEAIRKILSGDVYASPSATAKILKNVSAANKAGSFTDLLSDRELQVFRLIGDGYKTRHIAEKLILSAKTVESYKARLKQKLSLNNAAELARHAAEWAKSGGHA